MAAAPAPGRGRRLGPQGAPTTSVSGNEAANADRKVRMRPSRER